MEQTKPDIVPGLTLDIKKRRIRIHTTTLNYMDNPLYFRFLVNPKKKTLIVEVCSRETRGAFCRLNASFHHNSMELYSKTLIDCIVDCANLQQFSVVRLYGKALPGQRAIYFPIEPRIDSIRTQSITLEGCGNG